MITGKGSVEVKTQTAAPEKNGLILSTGVNDEIIDCKPDLIGMSEKEEEADRGSTIRVEDYD